MNDDTQIDELINDIYLRLQEVSKSDFYYLKRRFNRLKKAKASTGNQWCKLEKEVDVSIDKLQRRKQNIPSCNFDPQLPVNQRTDEIITAIEQEQVLILCGETGSGKTTQLPKLCLQAGRGIHGLIGHTQPRRIAAKSVAKRIADELGSDLGSFVGYKIRHHDKTDSNNTYIKLMTDGILLAEMQQDKYLNQYDTLIIDEAHERSLNIDFILGYLKQLLAKRPDLKIIITSATIDVERFSAHFNNASIIEVSGRNWPVDISYLPIDESDDENEVEEREEYILQAIKDLGSIDTGDILIFMEGEGEIHETDKFLRKQKLVDTEILPLYARLSSSRQNKIFAPHKKRHIVLATNIAETSLTIPGIRYVIDTGMARVSRYSYRNKIQRLPTEKISRAAANQRKGRCGRTSDGICIRLYSEEDFLSRSEFTQPEILRTNLASVILKMKALKLGDITDFPFIDPPDKKFINDGIRVLKEINALDVEGKLTPIGKKISRIPVDPRYARILLAGHDFNCLNEILIIISALSIQDPRERPVDKTKKADEAHNKFNDDVSDFVWFVNLWSFYHVQMKKLSQNKLRKLCQQNFISYVRMLEWLDLHRQLRHICTELELIINSEPADYKNIHCAILTGMPSHVAQLTGKHEYTGARNIKLNIFPGSGQFENHPKWFVAADLVETSRLFARTVARIEPQWLINTAKHLLNFTYSEPEWDSKNARVIAYERISLYGLILSANKKVNYGKIELNEARAIFVRCGLINGDFENSIEFYKHNNQLIKDIRKLEIKSRRPDILDEEVIFDFYMNKLPEDVYDGQSFFQWTKKLKNNQTKHLFLSKEEIMRHDAEDVSNIRFPDSIKQHGMSMPLNYKFEPGQSDDGLTVDVPLEVLSQFDENQMDYLVPGLLIEKIILLLKSLPKNTRKALVPIPETAKKCMELIKNHSIPLRNNLARILYQTHLLEIDARDWTDFDMPTYLQVNYRIFDSNNKVLECNKNITELKQKYTADSEIEFNRLVNEKTDYEEIDCWDFGNLPISERIKVNNKEIIVYPGLIEEGEKIYRHSFTSRETADYYLKIAQRALIKKTIYKDIRYLRKNFSHIDEICLAYNKFGTKEELINALTNLVIDETFLYEKEEIREQEKFYSIIERQLSQLLSNSESVCVLLKNIFELYRKVIASLSSESIQQFELAYIDIEQQLEYMVYAGFLDDIPFIYLQQYPRYLESILKRIEKLEYSPEKDKKNVLLIGTHWNRIMKLVDNAYATDNFPPPLNEYRWMMEELRISLFTQELKTRTPVSLKRMDKLWELLQQSR